MGKTFCLIKPEGFARRYMIKRMISENDFCIDKEIEQPWSREKICKTYSVGKLHYPTSKANNAMANLIPDIILKKFPNPMVDAMILSSEGNTIENFINLCGPTKALEYVQKQFKYNTLRGRFGLRPDQSFSTKIDGYICGFDFNAIHKSSNEEELREEENVYF
jgi:nucleoside diphosphate kinase